MWLTPWLLIVKVCSAMFEAVNTNPAVEADPSIFLIIENVEAPLVVGTASFQR
jgi:hypothetical protein